MDIALASLSHLCNYPLLPSAAPLGAHRARSAPVPTDLSPFLPPPPASLEMNESSRWTEEEMETAKKGKPLVFFLVLVLLEPTQQLAMRWRVPDRRAVGQILPVSLLVYRSTLRGWYGRKQEGFQVLVRGACPVSAAPGHLCRRCCGHSPRASPTRAEPAVGNGEDFSSAASCSLCCV